VLTASVVSPGHPASVAYDYEGGTIKWTSPVDDLPGAGRRNVAAILMGQAEPEGYPADAAYRRGKPYRVRGVR